MMIRNSVKQISRTPFPMLMFLAFIAGATVLMTTGINLWRTSIAEAKDFASLFTTIGTVQQKEDATQVVGEWSAETKEYTYIRKSAYSEWVSEEALDFEGANYIVKPRKRPYFAAYVPDYQLYSTEEQQVLDTVSTSIVAVVTPFQSGDAAPLEVEVTNQLNGGEGLIGQRITVCDHSNPDPIHLEKGKNYIMMLGGPIPGHGWSALDEAEGQNAGLEYYIEDGIYVPKVSKPGEKEDVPESDRYCEVTEGFYDTSTGEMWKTVAEDYKKLERTIPVQPVDRTCLLNSFYRKDMTVQQGRDITNQEYDQGEKVCLVPRKLAEYNQWQVGDIIELPLYMVSYAYPPVYSYSESGSGIGISFVKYNKKVYEPFDSITYQIVGIYDGSDTGECLDNLAKNEVIVPYNSIQNDWSDHIVDDGPMKSVTTSFQIPNGSIDAYRKAFAKAQQKNPELAKLEIKFYDRGYSKLQDGIRNRKIMAYVFIISGMGTTFLILLFFCHLFITKQRKRTAVERVLGVSKGKCMLSLMVGVSLIVLLGVAAGGALGYGVSQRITEDHSIKISYDDTFSKGFVEDANANDTLMKTKKAQRNVLPGTLGGMAIVIIVAGAISYISIQRNLKNEPLYLLGELEE